MIFHDFWKFTKFNDPTNTGRPPQMVRGVFPARKRAFPRCLKTCGTYFRHFSGFDDRYRVIETSVIISGGNELSPLDRGGDFSIFPCRYHPGWSGKFLPAGNARFRGVLKSLNKIFNISQVLVAGAVSSGLYKSLKVVEFDQNH